MGVSSIGTNGISHSRRSESKGVPTAEPHECDDAGDGKGLHDGGEDILDADHARVIKAKTRNRHHENEGCAQDHESGITVVGSKGGLKTTSR